MVRLGPEEARVTFIVQCKTTRSQKVRIVGDHAILGGWDPLRGPELWSSGNDNTEWRIELKIPANHTLSYKYVCMSPIAFTPGTRPETVDPVQDETPMQAASPLSPPSSTPAVSPADFNTVWESFDEYRQVSAGNRSFVTVDDGEFDVLNEGDAGRVRSISRVLSSRPSRESDLGSDLRTSASGNSLSMPPDSDSVIIAIYRLPVISERDPDTGAWLFAWDDDALYLTSTGLRRGLDKFGIKPLWVGILNTAQPVPERERDAVSATLRERFNCIPIFLSEEVLTKFYQGFCKAVLWRPFHMLPNTQDASGQTVRFDEGAWHIYQRVNRTFSNVIVEHYERQVIWVHDYHLMMLPYYLRIRLSGVKIGFYLHIPWPSSEIFRMLPVRLELLKALLSATMLGFHLFDYARHFLSACVRLLNLEHEARRGNLGIEYEGRHVTIRVSHIGVDPDRFHNRLGGARVRHMAAEYEAKYPSKTLLGAIDDLDYIKGIALKLIAFDHYLASASQRVRNKVALIQVAIPKTARVEQSVRGEIRTLVDQINSKYGTDGHLPVLYIEKQISFDERIAIYRVCDALFLTPVRDGLNLIPYEYIVSTPNGKGQLILSEFTGCSRALSSAVRVNPWRVDEVRDVIDNVVQKREACSAEIRLKHEADYRYVNEHSSITWAESFLRDLGEASESVQEVVRLGLSRAGGFRRLEFEGFTMLNTRVVVKAYRESKQRLFLFDYDGTLTQINSENLHMAHTWARPSEELLRNLELLSQQEGCSVVILSGRGTETEGFHTTQMEALGIAAEHGFYYKEPGSRVFLELAPEADLSWVEIAYPIMQLYTDRTDGSYIEEKSAGLVWHYLAADPEFGQWQAKEMHDHLESLLAVYNVQVISGHGWLQVRLSTVNKGKMVSKLLNEMKEKPDFILCCGDDRTDEDMFAVLGNDEISKECRLFTATVGVKPSNARYYLRNSAEVANIIEGIVEIALPGSATHVRSSTLEDMRPAALRRLQEQNVESGDAGSSLVRRAGNGFGRRTASSSFGSLNHLDEVGEGES